MTDMSALATVMLSSVHESYKAQIEELQWKLKQLEDVRLQRDLAWEIIDRIEAFFTEGHYMARQEWEDD